nr:MAG TPA: hypothetical protein [Caudoviricetes sp.]
MCYAIDSRYFNKHNSNITTCLLRYQQPNNQTL